jgi:hypothetical protein
MKHLGPWVLGAGIALLGAGVISTGSNSWRQRQPPPAQVIELDMQGVESLDMGNLSQASVEIARQPARMVIEWWDVSRDPKDTPTATRIGSQMRLVAPARNDGMGPTSVKIEPGLSLISGRMLNIHAFENAGTLALEPFNLNWEGDADALDIRVQAQVHSIDAR